MKNLLLSLSVCLVGLSASALTVVSGTVFHNTSTYDSDGYIIEAGGSLYFAPGVYKFDPGKSIEVATDGYFQVDGPNVTLKCSDPTDYWGGVIAYASYVPYNATNAMPKNWGFVSKHNIIVERAKIAMYMLPSIGIYNPGTNSINTAGTGYARGILTNNNSTTSAFLENAKYDIVIENNMIADNYSASGFGTTSWKNYYFRSTSPDYVASIYAINTNLRRVIEHFKIDTPNDGIHLRNSNMTMTDSDIIGGAVSTSTGILHKINTNNLMSTTLKNLNIKAYEYGVFTSESEGFYIGNSEIKSVDYGVFAYQTEEAVISNNKLYNSKYAIELKGCTVTRGYSNQCIDNPGMSIFVNSCNDTKLLGNLIGWNGSSVLSDEGIYVDNSNNTRIIRNLFKRAVYPLSFHGNNPTVRIHCNTFYDPTATIYAAISVFDNPINDQGGSGPGGANNYFNLLPPTTIRVRNNVAPTLTFTNTFAIPGNLPSVNTNFGINASYNANCNVPKMAQVAEVEAEDFTPTPNPFTNYLNIGEDIASVQIYSISGQMIENIKTTDTQVNLEHLNSGTYFVILNQTNGSTTRHKVVKQ